MIKEPVRYRFNPASILQKRQRKLAWLLCVVTGFKSALRHLHYDLPPGDRNEFTTIVASLIYYLDHLEQQIRDKLKRLQ